MKFICLSGFKSSLVSFLSQRESADAPSANLLFFIVLPCYRSLKVLVPLLSFPNGSHPLVPRSSQPAVAITDEEVV